jgi:hypothetical protein
MGNLHVLDDFSFLLLVPPTKSYDPFLWAAHIVHHSSDNFNLNGCPQWLVHDLL